MKALENKTQDSKREIDILNSLDEIRAVNNKHNKAREPTSRHPPFPAPKTRFSSRAAL